MDCLLPTDWLRPLLLPSCPPGLRTRTAVCTPVAGWSCRRRRRLRFRASVVDRRWLLLSWPLALSSGTCRRIHNDTNLNTTTTHLCPSSRSTRLSRAVTAPALRAPAHVRPCANYGHLSERSSRRRPARALGCSCAALECTQCIPPIPCQMVALGTASWTCPGPLTRLPSTPQVRRRDPLLTVIAVVTGARARVRYTRRSLPYSHRWSR